MRRYGIITAAAVSLLALGCQKTGSAGLEEKLESIDKRLSGIEAKLEKGVPAAAGKRGAKRPSRPRPNPKDVYSVPIEGAAYVGAKHAKITVVEAFEFA